MGTSFNENTSKVFAHEDVSMNARERLANARMCMANGQYADALLDLVWFHEFALAEDPSWAGVRRSYALDDWVQLGKVYPPALSALEDAREQKATVLLTGELNKSAFRDVASIDDYLGSTLKTYSLFKDILKLQPELAKAYARDAIRSILAAEDYQLASQLTPDAASLVKSKSAELNREVRLFKYGTYSRAPVRWAYVCNYVEDIQALLKIKIGIGEHAEASRLKSLAIALIESPSLRREVQAGFVKRPRAPIRRR
jgi:hypothetical protein